MEVEDHDRDAVVAAKGEGRRVHHVQVLGQGLLVGERVVARGGGVLRRIGGIDAVDLRGLEEGVGTDLGRAEGRAGVGGEEGVARAAGEEGHGTLAHQADGLACVEELCHLRHGAGRHGDGGNADALEGVLHGERVDDRRQHAHRVAQHAVGAVARARQAAEDVAAADDHADLRAQGHQLREPLGHVGQNRLVMAGIGGALQHLAAELQKNPLVL